MQIDRIFQILVEHSFPESDSAVLISSEVIFYDKLSDPNFNLMHNS